MAYGAPELLRVGAAQNLVLGGSTDNGEFGICQATEKEDDVGWIYDGPGFW